MTDHVFARLTGFSLTILPRTPFRAESTGADIQLVHDSASGPRAARLGSKDGTLSFELDTGTKSLEDVAEVARGAARDEWLIETAVFTACWPEGFEIVSRPEAPGYDLARSDGVLLYPQGPTRAPMKEDRLVAPGQQVTKKGLLDKTTRWVELSYEHDGQPWKQRHYLVPFAAGTIVVTLQAPSSSFKDAVPAAEAFARSIRPVELLPPPSPN